MFIRNDCICSQGTMHGEIEREEAGTFRQLYRYSCVMQNVKIYVPC